MTNPVGALLLVETCAPAAAVILPLILRGPRLAEAVNLAAAILSFVAAAALLPLAPAPGHMITFWHGYIGFDALGAWVGFCTACVYLLASIHSVGYMRGEPENAPRLYAYYSLFAGFALTMFAGALMNQIGLFWIAIEFTTLVSTFLVAYERTPGSIEAAWKYIMVVSAGLSIALLGTVVLYWGGTFVLGPTYQMTWATLAGAAAKMDPKILLLGFLLMVVGYGTKVGLAPMHTWLPDAHSEGPAPVSAMLSGALLNVAMLGILRFLAIARAATPGPVASLVLLGFGLVSITLAAFFILRQRGVKRLMAYSSVEHMGVIALGLGFGGVLGTTGALLHMLLHSLNKSLMFFGAGNVMRAYGSPLISRIRGVGRDFPVSGALWLAGAVAITGAPPFGLFVSEFTILRGGLAGGFALPVVIMAILLILIFIGFLGHFRAMFHGSVPEDQPKPRPLSPWSVLPMWLALIPLVVIGVWMPDHLWQFLTAIAGSLTAPATGGAS